MKKTILISLLVASFSAATQEYQDLEADNWVYDVEAIVFGRNFSQPDADTLKSRQSSLDVSTRALLSDYEELPLIRDVVENPSENESGQWQVPLEGERPKKQALIWVLLSEDMNQSVVNKLQTNPTLNPLHYQKWRQPATPFLSPEYVRIPNPQAAEIIVEHESPFEEPEAVEAVFSSSTFDESLTDTPHTTQPDFTFEGVVAFSKQQFTHAEVKVNYHRLDQFGETISYTINQKQRIQLGEWQYFDHQQFGVMIKVSKIVTGEDDD